MACCSAPQSFSLTSSKSGSIGTILLKSTHRGCCGMLAAPRWVTHLPLHRQLLSMLRRAARAFVLDAVSLSVPRTPMKNVALLTMHRCLFFFSFHCEEGSSAIRPPQPLPLWGRSVLWDAGKFIKRFGLLFRLWLRLRQGLFIIKCFARNLVFVPNMSFTGCTVKTNP